MILYRQSIKISPINQTIIVFITIVIILVALIFNWIWMDSLYKEGVNIIHSAQTHLRYDILKVVNNLFSMLCHPSTVGVVILIQLCVVKHKFKAFIHISFFLFCIYIIALMKQAYQQSRPIWSSKLIHKWEWFCPTDFGNPSGHSFALLPLYQPLISKYIGFQNFKFGWIFLIIFGFLVPFSRTYLGVHSVNQVMFGLTLGVAAAVLYRYGIRGWMYRIFSKILKNQKLKYLIIAVCLHVACFLVPFLFFSIYSQKKPMQQKDIQNLNEFCLTSLTSYLIQESMLVKCTMESFVFGIIYGLYFMKSTYKDKLYFAGRWNYSSYKSAFLHFLTILLIVGVLAGIFIVGLPRLFQSTFLDYLSNTIGMILVGFAIIFIVPKIQRSYQWIDYNEGTLLQEQQLKQNNEKAKIGQYFK